MDEHAYCINRYYNVIENNQVYGVVLEQIYFEKKYSFTITKF